MIARPNLAPRRRSPVARASAFGLLVFLPATSPPSSGQEARPGDSNILFPVDYIEDRLRAPALELLDVTRSRPLEEDRGRRVTLGGPAGEPPMQAHLKPVAPPGHGFNNEPRHELAAYRFQTLFLDEAEYVVPPTVLRAMPIEEYREIRSVRSPTIRGTRSVLFLLAYWIQNVAVDTADPFSPGLFDAHAGYRRNFAHANLFTHLIDHKDGNHGNVLVSMDGQNPRVFAVDNDVAFRSPVSDRGDRWRHLLVDRLPADTVERLRAITRERLDAELGVLAEFRVVDGYLEPTEPGPNLRPRQGVRVRDDRVQFGLTQAEIGDIQRRIDRLLRDVDRGRLATF